MKLNLSRDSEASFGQYFELQIVAFFLLSNFEKADCSIFARLVSVTINFPSPNDSFFSFFSSVDRIFSFSKCFPHFPSPFSSPLSTKYFSSRNIFLLFLFRFIFSFSKYLFFPFLPRLINKNSIYILDGFSDKFQRGGVIFNPFGTLYIRPYPL